MSGPISIATLVNGHMSTTGDSLEDLAKKCGLSKSVIGELSKIHVRRTLQTKTIEGLARGLKLPLHVIKSAAMVTAGLTPTDAPALPQHLELIIEKLKQLTDNDLETVQILIDGLAARAAKNG